MSNKFVNTASPLPHCLAIVALLACCGCATQAKVERYRAPVFKTGSARLLTLVQITGEPDLRDLLRGILASRLGDSQWWQYRDRHTAGIALFPAARPGQAARGGEPAQDEIFLRIDAYASRVSAREHEHGKNAGKGGNDQDEQRLEACVRFAATMVDAHKMAVMAEREYAGRADKTGSRVNRRQLLRTAANDAVKRLLLEITPRRVVDRIAIDKSADDMALVADLVARGQYALARRKLELKRRRYPLRADIVYNLAVLTDTRGEYQQALQLYDQALRLGYKPFYRRSRDACARRLRERRELGR